MLQLLLLPVVRAVLTLNFCKMVEIGLLQCVADGTQ